MIEMFWADVECVFENDVQHEDSHQSNYYLM